MAVAVLLTSVALVAGDLRRVETMQLAQSVASIDDLRPKTPDQVAEALEFSGIGVGMLLIDAGRVVLSEGSDAPTPPRMPEPVYADVLRNMVCDSDAALVGTPVAQHVLLNSTETFLFTDYEIAVTDWIHGRPPAPVRPEPTTTISVSFLGGQAIVGGKTLTAVGAMPLEQGHAYVLLVKRIPGSRSWRSAGLSMDLVGSSAVVREAKSRRLPLEMRGAMNAGSLTAALHAAAARCNGAGGVR
jgi:hypothetical protein